MFCVNECKEYDLGDLDIVSLIHAVAFLFPQNEMNCTN